MGHCNLASTATGPTRVLQVHPGLIELDPEDSVIVINYEVKLSCKSTLELLFALGLRVALHARCVRALILCHRRMTLRWQLMALSRLWAEHLASSST